jgi:predicted RNase H-like HicB family nuclease
MKTMSPAEYLTKQYGRVVMPEADGSFRAEIMEFPGCIATGDTPAEALANLDDVAASWLEATIARGLPIPQPMEESGYSGKLVVRLPKSLHRKAAHQAAKDGVSLNQFIVASIAEQVGSGAAVQGALPLSPVLMRRIARLVEGAKVASDQTIKGKVAL